MDPQQMAMFGDPAWSQDRPDNDEDLVNSRTSEDDDEDEQEAQEERPGEKPPSREELLGAYTQAKQIIDEKTLEADSLRDRLQAMGAEAQSLLEKVQQDTFMRELHEAYQKDPVGATALLVQQARSAMLDQVEARLAQAFRDQRNFQRFMSLFLEDPAHAHLRPHRHELETMILDKGLSPSDAADIIRSIETQREKNVSKRSAAAREVRNRSTVETGGGASESVDKDKEFEKVLKKAKTLDEMFAGLRRLKL